MASRVRKLFSQLFYRIIDLENFLSYIGKYLWLDLYLTKKDFAANGFLGPLRGLKDVIYFHKKGPSSIFDRNPNPVDTRRKLNVHKTFRRLAGRFLNVSCTFNLRPVSTGKYAFDVLNFFTMDMCNLIFQASSLSFILQVIFQGYSQNFEKKYFFLRGEVFSPAYIFSMYLDGWFSGSFFPCFCYTFTLFSGIMYFIVLFLFYTISSLKLCRLVRSTNL